MIFNILSHLLHSINQFILWVSIIFFYNYSNYSINWLDIYTRILNNEYYINTYYFLWTSFWYIPLFIYTLILYKYFNSIQINNSILIGFILILWLSTLVDLHFYWALNTYNFLLTYKSNYFNSLLLNSINKFHPGLLYWTGLSILAIFRLYLSILNTCIYKFLNIFFNKIYIFILFITSLSLTFTLALGGWWALQEGSWGGWWNWDPSEVFGLLILLFFVISIHKRTSKQLLLNNYIYIFLYTLILLQIYFFTQLNFDLISHNFGTKIDNFIDNTNLYVFIINITLLQSFYLIYSYINLLKYYMLHIQSNFIFSNMIIWTYLIIILYIYIILYSLIPLVNDFLWKLININILNYILIFEKINLQIFFIILGYFWEYKIIYLFFLPLLLISFNLVLFPFLYLKHRYFIFFHLCIILFIWLSLLSLHFNFSIWDIYSNKINIDMWQSFISLNNLSIDSLFSYYSNLKLYTAWNTIWYDTTLEVYSFFFNFKINWISQLMMTGININQFIISIIDILSINFIIQIFILFITILIYIYKPLQIIF